MSHLHDAVKEGNQDALKYWLARNEDPTLLDEAGLSPLHLAARQGEVDILIQLLHHGAPVDLPDRTKKTALMHAALTGQELAVKLLLGMGANPQAKDDAGLTPMDFALVSPKPDLADLFSSEGLPKVIPQSPESWAYQKEDFSKNTPPFEQASSTIIMPRMVAFLLVLTPFVALLIFAGGPLQRLWLYLVKALTP